MLRSRAAHFETSISQVRRSINVQWTRTRASLSDADTTQNSAQEEDVFMKNVYNIDSAFIRTYPFPESMRDAYAIIRAVERKYGLIKEFKFFRDGEVSTNYQSIVKVAFRNPESRKRIPEDAEELQVVLPPAVPLDQPGGIGLADLEEYLETTESAITSCIDSNSTTVPMLHKALADVIEESEEKAETETAERVITCRIQRAGASFYTSRHLSLYWPSRREREAIARQLLNWGGFHDFSPLPANHPLPNEDFFNGSQLEHFRMRCCLRSASELLEMPNPYEVSPKSVPHSTGSIVSTKDFPQLEWEPLSGPESTEVEYDPLHVAFEGVKRESSVGSTFTEPFIHTSDSTKTAPTLQTTDTSLDSRDANISTASPLEKTPSHVPPTSASSAENVHSKEMEAQLRAARSLARQVAHEQKRPAKSTSTLPEEAQSTRNKDSLLEQDPPEAIAGNIPVKPVTLLETPEQIDDPRQKQGPGVMGKLRNVWGGLF
ncbi:hypothetical protein APHAL10511_004780 [Amanita phalloides]|nr:hypothetical protein APHAL10511_004780 [Amanita phalloides]